MLYNTQLLCFNKVQDLTKIFMYSLDWGYLMGNGYLVKRPKV